MFENVFGTKSLILLFLFSAMNPLFAQNSDTLKTEMSHPKQDQESKLQELENLVKELQNKVEKQEKEDEMKKLLEEAKKLSTQERKEKEGLGKKFRSGVRQQSGLNPNISVGGDFFAAVSSSKSEFINAPGDVSYGNNRFHMRELEVALIAPLDPFTRGKTFFSFTESGINIEEAYMEWLNLPLNMNLKIGIFNVEYGILNRYHDHALPQFDRPRVMVHTFSNAPLGGFGLAGNFLLPRLFFSDASSLDLSVINGGSDFSFTSEGKFNLIGVGHINNYYDITRDTFFEWSMSGAIGKNDPAERYYSYVGDLGLTIKWAPVGRAKYRTIDWKTELLVNRRETPAGNIDTKGFYTSIQNKLNARYWLSGRIGYSELPWDKSQHEWDFTACLDVWQSEFVFFRFQYQYSLREFSEYLGFEGPFPKEHTLLFHVAWAMGPHKHEKY